MACWVVLVREDRRLSALVADETGIAHASPQAILFAGGRAVWTASHRAISREALTRALAGEEPAASGDARRA